MLWRTLIITLCLSTAPLLASPANAQELDEVRTIGTFINLMQEYHNLIDKLHDTAANPQKSTILRLQKLQEIYKERGEMDQVIRVLNQVVESTTDTTVRNAATIMLVDALNESGNSKQAVRVLEASLNLSAR